MASSTLTEQGTVSALLVFAAEDALTVREMRQRMDDVGSLLSALSIRPETVALYMKMPNVTATTPRDPSTLRKRRSDLLQPGMSVPIVSIDFHSPMVIGLILTTGTLLASRLVKLASALSSLRKQFAEDSLAIKRARLEGERVDRQVRIERDEEVARGLRVALGRSILDQRASIGDALDALEALNPIIDRALMALARIERIEIEQGAPA